LGEGIQCLRDTNPFPVSADHTKIKLDRLRITDIVRFVRQLAEPKTIERNIMARIASTSFRTKLVLANRSTCTVNLGAVMGRALMDALDTEVYVVPELQKDGVFLRFQKDLPKSIDTSIIDLAFRRKN